MKKQLYYTIVLTLLFFSANVFSAEVPLVVHGNCAAFQVKLPSNPTTGYQWSIEQFDRKTYLLLENDYIAPSEVVMGAPGAQAFYFQLKKSAKCPKRTRLCFSYARSWESEDSRCIEVIVDFTGR